ncbi:hypothetical protein BCEP4_790022 [Burkholderia cepacia]|nr:hypothetical protein BCEP4_790022 [Burkholderia cepacia]
MTISRLQRYSQSFERALKLCCFRCRRCVYGKHISRRRDVQLYCFPHCGAVHRAHCSSPLTSDATPARGHGAPLGLAPPGSPDSPGPAHAPDPAGPPADPSGETAWSPASAATSRPAAPRVM